MKRVGVLCIVLIVMFFAACSNQHDPLSKLQSDTAYDDLNTAFWSKEHDQKTTLWSQALSFCKAHQEKPNCAAVIEVHVVSNGQTVAPAIGHSGSTLTIPDFKDQK